MYNCQNQKFNGKKILKKVVRVTYCEADDIRLT